MSKPLIETLFTNDIYRRIEEVIKVDQADEEILHQEIAEYVVTDAIRRYYTDILDRYWETPNKPHEGVAVWVSGFFGSGKSSFAKMLGLALENRPIRGRGAAELFSKRTGDRKIEVLLRNITERIPTHSVIFDISTDRGIRSGSQTLTEIMYRLFLQSLGYARDLDLSELEITLEAEDRLDRFKETFTALFDKDWDREKGKVAFAISKASKVMRELEPDLYPAADSWARAARNRSDITPRLLAERCRELMDRRRPGRSLAFVIDEVGQFVARDVQKMLDLQAVVQNLGRVGRGRMWIVVTSQEKLGELVGGLDDKRIELARLMDRFPLQVHLEPSDISEVTSKRVLSKNAGAQKKLREVFSRHRGRLTENTRLTADIRMPALNTERFVELYPLLPYQVDLIIQVVSGLRTREGAGKHVGGANRTIIKLAQQLLIHPGVKLAKDEVGSLARIDQIYNLVSGNIAGEIRGKIDAVKKQMPQHPLARPAAKAVCLLQYAKSIHRTAENISAALHPGADADSRLPEVKAALAALEGAKKVRLGDDGWRIPTPAEDDWENQRSKLAPKPGDVHRIHTDIVEGFWSPPPSHMLLNVKLFKAGLFYNGKLIADGDIPVHLFLAEKGEDYDARASEMRARSQTETENLFWVAAIDRAIDRETVEVFRSKEILSRKERGARTKDETALVAEEKVRLRRCQGELKRLIEQACLNGVVFFRGNDRGPDESASDAGKTAAKLLAQVAPLVFDRFEDAAARIGKKDLEALLTTENLLGLPPVFSSLDLVRDQSGKPVFDVDGDLLKEVFSFIENRTSYGESATGRRLADAFSKKPFGWEFDMVRLLAVSLLRAGKVEATSKGRVIESALSLDAKTTFLNNNLFRHASFRPKIGIEFPQLLEAVDAFKKAFGHDIPEIQQTVAAKAIREEIGRHEEDLQAMYMLLAERGMPGADVLEAALDNARLIRNGNEENAILTFNACHQELKEAVKRAAELSAALTEPNLYLYDRATRARTELWPFLREEPDIGDSLRADAELLIELLEGERFFREFPDIELLASRLEEEHRRRFDEALQEREAVYRAARETLASTPGWEKLNDDQKAIVLERLPASDRPDSDAPARIALLRENVAACPDRLNKAVEEMMVILDGQRITRLSASNFFQGGVETLDQLDASLKELRRECKRLIDRGKKVLLQ